jgi:NAD+ synthase
MTTATRIEHITQWIRLYATRNNIEHLVVGISGGIDSSVVSTLSAMTGLNTTVVSMPIRQRPELHDLSMRHGEWLTDKFGNVEHRVVDLTPVFDSFEKLFDQEDKLALANSRARLRMTCLYQIAQERKGLVVGTGNKVEDFGVGFYTKYGDGGVDISPIGDCMKTDVWDMGIHLKILDDIIEAAPTDGLWDDGRNDEDQLGMSYPELEEAMRQDQSGERPADAKQMKNLLKYKAIRAKTKHKMEPIPVCMLGDNA